MALKIAPAFSQKATSSVVVGQQTFTLSANTIKSGQTLENGEYYLIADPLTTGFEVIKCTITGTSVTAIQSVHPITGALTTGFSKIHTATSDYIITDWQYIKDLLFQIEDQIVDGVLDKAPSQNAVFDALALKATVVALTAGLATKEALVTVGTTAQYYRGDKTFQTLDKTAVGLSNVDNTSDANKPLSNAENSALALKADTTTLALKANLASPTFTGTVTVPTPTSGTSAANKSYVDSLVGVTATDLNIPTTTSLSVGTIRQNGTRLIHTYGSSNLFIGLGSGNYSTTGGGNITLGGANLVSNTTGQENLALGISALQNNTTGDSNTASGRYSLVYNTTGSSNTAIGVASLLSNTTGSSNTAIGTSSLFSNVTGSNNIGIGAAADVVANNLTNAIVIGSTATVNASNKIRLGNTLITAFDCQVALTVTSDIRTKGSIEDLNQGLAFVNSLRPVSYEMNSDPSKKTYYGFIAQEVQAALPKDTSIVSVVGKHSDNTDLLGVRYQDLIAPLYKAVQELSTRVINLENK